MFLCLLPAGAFRSQICEVEFDFTTFHQHVITPRRACAARGKVIALGLGMSAKKFQNTHFQKSTPTTVSS